MTICLHLKNSISYQVWISRKDFSFRCSNFFFFFFPINSFHVILFVCGILFQGYFTVGQRLFHFLDYVLPSRLSTWKNFNKTRETTIASIDQGEFFMARVPRGFVELHLEFSIDFNAPWLISFVKEFPTNLTGLNYDGIFFWLFKVSEPIELREKSIERMKIHKICWSFEKFRRFLLISVYLRFTQSFWLTRQEYYCCSESMIFQSSFFKIVSKKTHHELHLVAGFILAPRQHLKSLENSWEFETGPLTRNLFGAWVSV